MTFAASSLPPQASREPRAAPAAPLDCATEEAPGTPSFAQLLATGLADPGLKVETDAAEPMPAADDAAAVLEAIRAPAGIASAPSAVPASPTPAGTRAARAIALTGAPAAPPADVDPSPGIEPTAPSPSGARPSAEAALRSGGDAAGEVNAPSQDRPATQGLEHGVRAHGAPALEHSRAPHPLKVPAAGELQAPAATAQWSRDLGETLRWMVGARHSVAELRLNPPELGALQIVLTLAGDDRSQASVAFVSPHGEVREAIEAALPRLREMLAGSGIQLGDASVDAQTARADAGADPARSRGERALEIGAPAATAAASGTARLRAGAGLIDVFA